MLTNGSRALLLTFFQMKSNRHNQDCKWNQIHYQIICRMVSLSHSQLSLQFSCQNIYISCILIVLMNAGCITEDTERWNTLFITLSRMYFFHTRYFWVFDDSYSGNQMVKLCRVFFKDDFLWNPTCGFYSFYWPIHHVRLSEINHMHWWLKWFVLVHTTARVFRETSWQATPF